MGLPTDPRHSWSFVIVKSAIALADRAPASPVTPATVAGAYGDLLKLFSSVSDGRSGQGRDHPVGAVLALAAAAVVAGMKGYTAIAGWVRGSQRRCWRTCICGLAPAPAPPPSKATIWRVVTDADAGAFDATVGNWLMSSLLREQAAQGGTAGPGQDGAAGSGRDRRQG